MAKKKNPPLIPVPQGAEGIKITSLSNMYESYFLDYASYVILERAVPAMEDGLKPVQRRILHSLYEIDDGRFNKVANVIGHTMQYHPHGDAAIRDAMVNLGQMELLIDTQGNWGDPRTGASSAAPRYIEARLTKFALEVMFNPKTTSWLLSYDAEEKSPSPFLLNSQFFWPRGLKELLLAFQPKYCLIILMKSLTPLLNILKENDLNFILIFKLQAVSM
jgi:topoisomerase-4 subunit A